MDVPKVLYTLKVMNAMKRLIVLAPLLAAVAIPPAWSDDDLGHGRGRGRHEREMKDREDHDRARDAVRSGAVVPLSRILEAVERDFTGHFLEVELEPEDDGWIYEVKLLSDQGSVLKLIYDARTAELRRARGHGVDAARRVP